MTSNKLIEDIANCLDAKDAERFATYFTVHGTYRTGNQPPVTGRENILEHAKTFFNIVKTNKHSIVSVEETPSSIIWQGIVSYERVDGLTVTCLHCTILHLDGDKIKQYMVYCDNNEFYSPMGGGKA